MSGHAGNQPQDPAAREEALRALDTRHAHSARVYDYWLGGNDHFTADREAAEQAIAANPGMAAPGQVTAWCGVARKEPSPWT
jgi:hypothetical protein